MMEKRDQGCIWARHCESYPCLRSAIIQLIPGEQLNLLINGSPTVWVRMNDGTDSRPTLGIRIVGDRSAWQMIKLREFCEIIPLQSIDSESD